MKLFIFQLSAAACFMSAINVVTSPPFNLLHNLFAIILASAFVGAGIYNLFIIKAIWND